MRRWARHPAWLGHLLVGALMMLLLGLFVVGLIVAQNPERAPLFGWQLTTSETGLAGAGVDRNELAVFTGRVRPGMTLSRVKIVSPLDLSLVANVTLDRVWLAPQGGRQALVLGSGTVVTDSDIDGSAMQSAERIGIYGNVPSRYTISRVSVTGTTVGAWLDGSGMGTMTDTYIHALVSNGGQHMDGFTRRAGTGPLTIARSRIEARGASVTGAFFLQDTWGGTISGITVVDTLLDGMGYSLTLENHGAGTSVGMQNVRVRATGWGPISASPLNGHGVGAITYSAWSDVRTFDPSRLPRADGAVINHP